MTAGVSLRWRDPISDEEMVELTRSHGGNPSPGWWPRVSAHSLGWVSARTADGKLVGFAAMHAKAAGCEWLHVDFDDELEPFYFDACGFSPTKAGLIHLPSLGDYY